MVRTSNQQQQQQQQQALDVRGKLCCQICDAEDGGECSGLDESSEDEDEDAAAAAAALNHAATEYPFKNHDYEKLQKNCRRFVCADLLCGAGMQSDRLGMTKTVLIGCFRFKCSTPSSTVSVGSISELLQHSVMTTIGTRERELLLFISKFSCAQFKIELKSDSIPSSCSSSSSSYVHCKVLLPESMIHGRYMYQQAVTEVRFFIAAFAARLMDANEHRIHDGLLNHLRHVQSRIASYPGLDNQRKLLSLKDSKELMSFVSSSMQEDVHDCNRLVSSLASDSMSQVLSKSGFEGQLSVHQQGSVARMMAMTKRDLESLITVNISIAGMEGVKYSPYSASFRAHTDFNHVRGGILGDDNGMGKTVTTLAWLSLYKTLCKRPSSSGAPSLVVCNSTLVVQWQNHLAKHCPLLSVKTLISLNNSSKNAKIPTSHELAHVDVVITTADIIKALYAKPEGSPLQQIFRDCCSNCGTNLIAKSQCKVCATSRTMPGPEGSVMRGRCLRCNSEEKTVETKVCLAQTCVQCGKATASGSGFWDAVIVDDADDVICNGNIKRSRAVMALAQSGTCATAPEQAPVVWFITGAPLRKNGLSDMIVYADALRLNVLPMSFRTAATTSDLEKPDRVLQLASLHLLKSVCIRHEKTSRWDNRANCVQPAPAISVHNIQLTSDETQTYQDLARTVQECIHQVDQLLGSRGASFVQSLFGLLRRYCSGQSVCAADAGRIADMAQMIGMRGKTSYGDDGELVVVVTRTTSDVGFNAEDACPICMEELPAEEDAIQITSCKHQFCLRCISRHFATGSRLCPLCRGLASPKQLAKVVRESMEQADCSSSKRQREDSSVQSGNDGTNAVSSSAIQPISSSSSSSSALSSSSSQQQQHISFKVRWMLQDMATKLSQNADCKFVVVTGFTSVLKSIMDQLQHSGVSVLSLRASMPGPRRAAILSRFGGLSGACVLGMTTRMAATAMALTNANVVYVLEPHNDQYEISQVCGRLYHMGQKNQVFVHQLVGSGTIEEKLYTTENATMLTSHSISMLLAACTQIIQ